MPFDAPAVKQHLRDFAFRTLFINELGWNKPGTGFPIELDGRTYHFAMVAEKGIAVFECVAPAGAAFPDHSTRLKLERHVAKLHQENILIFTDAARTRQSWLWVKREANGPPRSRQETYLKGDTGERLAQKLRHLLVELDEEERFTLADALERRKRALDVEKVTKKFFERFQKEHAAFLKFIDGLPEESRAWYASLMLNRLMFVYFIQRKGFLAGDQHYLRNRLATVQKEKGKDKFGAFYKHFLLRLFHEGLGKKKADRKTEFDKLLGDVPYLNGGLFDVHELEDAHADIAIPDAAFTKLFEFFDAYDWHLDDRPLRKDNEINPDVLGFIFEKYVNQKQMGAYYTKEDITGYITRNSLLPFVLSRAKELCGVAFQPGGAVWRLLQERPDRYIYEAVRQGVDRELPPDIAAGVGDVSRRGGWNKLAADGFALPTETWREHVARRQRCLELRAKLRDGKVTSVDDLVTLNLDIVRFVTDVIDECEGADLLRALYQTLTAVTVLDPTCGSGAFLFAALNILEPLYDACLERMQGFVSEADAVGGPDAGERFRDFRAVLAEAERHPNRRYFVFRSVVVNNLYGVDLEKGAVEICKLRLFLKLVSQIEDAKDIEPLPDIDFNIRPGNTLVGFASLAEARKAVDVTTQTEFDQLANDAAHLAQYFSIYRTYQTQLREEPTQEKQLALTATKPFLRLRLQETCRRLDRYLAGVYGIDPDNAKAYSAWRDSHQPFHWFAEFYGIMAGGGFDVIIGNPPWKEYAAVRREDKYSIRGYATERCGNLHGVSTERALNLRAPNGVTSFIVQLPLTSSSRMATVRQQLTARSGSLWAIPFDDRPGKLFDGLQHCRSAIFISAAQLKGRCSQAMTRYQRWPTETREFLFPLVEFVPLFGQRPYPNLFAKVVSPVHRCVLAKLAGPGLAPLGDLTCGETKHFIFYQEATQYWAKATVGLPYYAKNGEVGAPAHGRYLYFATAQHAHAACAVLNSSLFYSHFITYGDCFHLSDGLATEFPVPKGALEDGSLTALNRRLMADLTTNAVRKTIRTKDNSTITYAEFFVSKSKPILDEIDAMLAKHYGFTAEELDFIVNYDIKYRLGAEGDGGDE